MRAQAAPPPRPTVPARTGTPRYRTRRITYKSPGPSMTFSSSSSESGEPLSSLLNKSTSSPAVPGTSKERHSSSSFIEQQKSALLSIVNSEARPEALPSNVNVLDTSKTDSQKSKDVCGKSEASPIYISKAIPSTSKAVLKLSETLVDFMGDETGKSKATPAHFDGNQITNTKPELSNAMANKLIILPLHTDFDMSKAAHKSLKDSSSPSKNKRSYSKEIPGDSQERLDGSCWLENQRQDAHGESNHGQGSAQSLSQDAGRLSKYVSGKLDTNSTNKSIASPHVIPETVISLPGPSHLLSPEQSNTLASNNPHRWSKDARSSSEDADSLSENDHTSAEDAHGSLKDADRASKDAGKLTKDTHRSSKDADKPSKEAHRSTKDIILSHEARTSAKDARRSSKDADNDTSDAHTSAKDAHSERPARCSTSAKDVHDADRASTDVHSTTKDAHKSLKDGDKPSKDDRKARRDIDNLSQELYTSAENAHRSLNKADRPLKDARRSSKETDSFSQEAHVLPKDTHSYMSPEPSITFFSSSSDSDEPLSNLLNETSSPAVLGTSKDRHSSTKFIDQQKSALPSIISSEARPEASNVNVLETSKTDSRQSKDVCEKSEASPHAYKAIPSNSREVLKLSETLVDLMGDEPGKSIATPAHFVGNQITNTKPELSNAMATTLIILPLHTNFDMSKAAHKSLNDSRSPSKNKRSCSKRPGESQERRDGCEENQRQDAHGESNDGQASSQSLAKHVSGKLDTNSPNKSIASPHVIPETVISLPGPSHLPSPEQSNTLASNNPHKWSNDARSSSEDADSLSEHDHTSAADAHGSLKDADRASKDARKSTKDRILSHEARTSAKDARRSSKDADSLSQDVRRSMKISESLSKDVHQSSQDARSSSEDTCRSSTDADKSSKNACRSKKDADNFSKDAHTSAKDAHSERPARCSTSTKDVHDTCRASTNVYSTTKDKSLKDADKPSKDDRKVRRHTDDLSHEPYTSAKNAHRSLNNADRPLKDARRSSKETNRFSQGAHVSPKDTHTYMSPEPPITFFSSSDSDEPLSNLLNKTSSPAVLGTSKDRHSSTKFIDQQKSALPSIISSEARPEASNVNVLDTSKTDSRQSEDECEKSEASRHAYKAIPSTSKAVLKLSETLVDLMGDEPGKSIATPAHFVGNQITNTKPELSNAMATTLIILPLHTEFDMSKAAHKSLNDSRSPSKNKRSCSKEIPGESQERRDGCEENQRQDAHGESNDGQASSQSLSKYVSGKLDTNSPNKSIASTHVIPETVISLPGPSHLLSPQQSNTLASNNPHRWSKDARGSSGDTRRSSIDADRASKDARSPSEDIFRSSKNARRSTKDADCMSGDDHTSAEDAHRSLKDADRASKDARKSTKDTHRSSKDADKPSKEAHRSTEDGILSHDARTSAKDVRRSSKDADRPLKDARRSAKDADSLSQDVRRSTKSSEGLSKDAHTSAKDVHQPSQDARSSSADTRRSSTDADKSSKNMHDAGKASKDARRSTKDAHKSSTKDADKPSKDRRKTRKDTDNLSQEPHNSAEDALRASNDADRQLNDARRSSKETNSLSLEAHVSPKDAHKSPKDVCSLSNDVCRLKKDADSLSKAADNACRPSLDVRSSSEDARKSSIDVDRSSKTARKSTKDANSLSKGARTATKDAHKSPRNARSSSKVTLRSSTDADRSLKNARKSTKDTDNLSKDALAATNDAHRSSQDARSSSEYNLRSTDADRSSKNARKSTKDADNSSKDARAVTKDAHRSSQDAHSSSEDTRRSLANVNRSSKNVRKSTKDADSVPKDTRSSTKDDHRSSKDARRSTKDEETFSRSYARDQQFCDPASRTSKSRPRESLRVSIHLKDLLGHYNADSGTLNSVPAATTATTVSLSAADDLISVKEPTFVDLLKAVHGTSEDFQYISKSHSTSSQGPQPMREDAIGPAEDLPYPGKILFSSKTDISKTTTGLTSPAAELSDKLNLLKSLGLTEVAHSPLKEIPGISENALLPEHSNLSPRSLITPRRLSNDALKSSKDTLKKSNDPRSTVKDARKHSNDVKSLLEILSPALNTQSADIEKLTRASSPSNSEYCSSITTPRTSKITSQKGENSPDHLHPDQKSSKHYSESITTPQHLGSQSEISNAAFADAAVEQSEQSLADPVSQKSVAKTHARSGSKVARRTSIEVRIPIKKLPSQLYSDVDTLNSFGPSTSLNVSSAASLATSRTSKDVQNVEWLGDSPTQEVHSSLKRSHSPAKDSRRPSKLARKHNKDVQTVLEVSSVALQNIYESPEMEKFAAKDSGPSNPESLLSIARRKSKDASKKAKNTPNHLHPDPKSLKHYSESITTPQHLGSQSEISNAAFAIADAAVEQSLADPVSQKSEAKTLTVARSRSKEARRKSIEVRIPVKYLPSQLHTSSDTTKLSGPLTTETDTLSTETVRGAAALDLSDPTRVASTDLHSRNPSKSRIITPKIMHNPSKKILRSSVALLDAPNNIASSKTAVTDPCTKSVYSTLMALPKFTKAAYSPQKEFSVSLETSSKASKDNTYMLSNNARYIRLDPSGQLYESGPEKSIVESDDFKDTSGSFNDVYTKLSSVPKIPTYVSRHSSTETNTTSTATELLSAETVQSCYTESRRSDIECIPMKTDFGLIDTAPCTSSAKTDQVAHLLKNMPAPTKAPANVPADLSKAVDSSAFPLRATEVQSMEINSGLLSSPSNVVPGHSKYKPGRSLPPIKAELSSAAAFGSTSANCFTSSHAARPMPDGETTPSFESRAIKSTQTTMIPNSASYIPVSSIPLPDPQTAPITLSTETLPHLGLAETEPTKVAPILSRVLPEPAPELARDRPIYYACEPPRYKISSLIAAFRPRKAKRDKIRVITELVNTGPDTLRIISRPKNTRSAPLSATLVNISNPLITASSPISPPENVTWSPKNAFKQPRPLEKQRYTTRIPYNYATRPRTYTSVQTVNATTTPTNATAVPSHTTESQIFAPQPPAYTTGSIQQATALPTHVAPPPTHATTSPTSAAAGLSHTTGSQIYATQPPMYARGSIRHATAPPIHEIPPPTPEATVPSHTTGAQTYSPQPPMYATGSIRHPIPPPRHETPPPTRETTEPSHTTGAQIYSPQPPMYATGSIRHPIPPPRHETLPPTRETTEPSHTTGAQIYSPQPPMYATGSIRHATPPPKHATPPPTRATMRFSHTTGAQIYAQQPPMYATPPPTRETAVPSYTTGAQIYSPQPPMYATGSIRHATAPPTRETAVPSYTTGAQIYSPQPPMYATGSIRHATAPPTRETAVPSYTTGAQIYSPQLPMYTTGSIRHATAPPTRETPQHTRVTPVSRHATEAQIYVPQPHMYPTCPTYLIRHATPPPRHATRQQRYARHSPIYEPTRISNLRPDPFNSSLATPKLINAALSLLKIASDLSHNANIPSWVAPGLPGAASGPITDSYDHSTMGSQRNNAHSPVQLHYSAIPTRNINHLPGPPNMTDQSYEPRHEGEVRNELRPFEPPLPANFAHY